VPEGGRVVIDDLPQLGEIWIHEIPAYNGVAVIKGFENVKMPLPVLERPIAAGDYTVVISWSDGATQQHSVTVRPGRDTGTRLNVRKGTR
jgi:hypothetical protein